MSWSVCSLGILVRGATRGVADRFIGKLIGLMILTLLVDIVLAIIINGFVTYVNNTLGDVATASKPEATSICTSLLIFLSDSAA